MKINFLGPVLPTDSQVRQAFVEILNIILLSDSIVDVNRMLISRNVNPDFGSLSGHFRWSYAHDHFTLWQRMEYNSQVCFPHRILELHFGLLVSKDRERDRLPFN